MAKNDEILTMEELVDLVNSREGDFIIHVTPRKETDDE